MDSPGAVRLAERFRAFCDEQVAARFEASLGVLSTTPAIAAIAANNVLFRMERAAAIAAWRAQLAIFRRERLDPPAKQAAESLRQALAASAAQVMRELSRAGRFPPARIPDLLALKEFLEPGLGPVAEQTGRSWAHRLETPNGTLMTLCDLASPNAQLRWRQSLYQAEQLVLTECHLFAGLGIAATARLDAIEPSAWRERVGNLVRALSWIVPFVQDAAS